MSKVVVEYDFTAQPGTGEMTVITGEILTIVKRGIEGGWIEAQNARGKCGLVPESYVAPYFEQVAAPTAVPPPPPVSAPLPILPSKPSAPLDDWGLGSFSNVPPIAPPYHSSASTPAASSLPPMPPPPVAPRPASTITDDFDDEWSDDDEEEQPDNPHRLSVSLLNDGSAVASVIAAGSRSMSAGRGARNIIRLDRDHSIDGDDERTLAVAPARRKSNHASRRRHTMTRSPRSDSDLKSMAGPVLELNPRFEEQDQEGGARRRSLIKSQSVCVKEVGQSQGHASLSGDARNMGSLSRSHSAGGGERAVSAHRINRNINRFTIFVKSGLESYILSDSVINVPASERIEIINSGPYGAQWRPVDHYYTCTVDKPKKESKLKGLKSFIAYTLTSSTSRIQVSRRYKHFDWLHDQLQSKFCMIPIPPLPEKQVAGRYEEDLIDHRKHILQLWVNRLCRHPVLSRSEVWLHFMTCTDEKAWKMGKRKAEKDELVGGNFFHCVTFPSQPLQVQEVERHVEVFQRSIRSMDDSVRVMNERLAVFQKLFSGPVKQNWQKMAAAYLSLGQSFEADQNPGSVKMTEALRNTAHHYHAIGEDFDRHTKDDMEPMLENLYSYKGTVQTMPDILNMHKQAIGKLRETEKACGEGRVSQTNAERIKKRVDSTSYMLLAEMNHINQEKVEDFKLTIGTFLKKQADFYQKMANTLNQLASHYQ